MIIRKAIFFIVAFGFAIGVYYALALLSLSIGDLAYNAAMG